MPDPWLSDRVVKGTELSFQTLTLNRGLSETLAEVVLRAVTSPMTTVAHHRHDHLLVFLVVGEHFLEALPKRVEITVAGGLSLENAGLDLRHAEIVHVYTVGALAFGAAVLRLEKVTIGPGHQGVHFVVSEIVVLGSFGGLGGGRVLTVHGGVQTVVTHGAREEALPRYEN